MDELLENARSFWRSAEIIYSTKDYTSAIVLYFKCLFALLDWVILKNKKKAPKDHTERFRILQLDFPELYTSLDRIFGIYRDAYSVRIEKDKCDEVKKYAAGIAQKQGVQLNNK